MAHIGVAPLTLVRTRTARTEYVYAGQVVPQDILPEDLERLVGDGYLAEVLEPEVTVVADDSGSGNAGEGVTLERPKSVANKAAWVDFRVRQQLMLAEQEDEVTADQLKDDEFMASFLQSRESQAS